MRILNCLKTTADPDQVPEAEWASGIRSGVFDFSFLKFEIDTFSESGLELTLRMADVAGRDKILTEALTVGGRSSEKALRTLLALGYRSCVRIDASPEVFYPEKTASLIAGHICRSGPYDVVIFGEESPDGQNRKVPLLTAELIGLPIIRRVRDISYIDETHIHVLHEIPEGLCEETVSTPAVLTVGNAPQTLLRVPTLMQRKAAADMKVKTVDPKSAAEAAGNSAFHTPDIRLEGYTLADQNRRGERIMETDPSLIAEVIRRCIREGR